MRRGEELFSCAFTYFMYDETDQVPNIESKVWQETGNETNIKNSVYVAAVVWANIFPVLKI